MNWTAPVDLAPHVEAIRAAVATRYGQHGEELWNPESWFIGMLGEKAYSLVSGCPIDLTSRPGGDGGVDFPDGTDAKSVEHTGRFGPTLMCHAKKIHKLTAPYLVLVVVGREPFVGRLVGWATPAELRAAPTEEFGRGPTHALRPGALHALPHPGWTAWKGGAITRITCCLCGAQLVGWRVRDSLCLGCDSHVCTPCQIARPHVWPSGPHDRAVHTSAPAKRAGAP